MHLIITKANKSKSSHAYIPGNQYLDKNDN